MWYQNYICSDFVYRNWNWAVEFLNCQIFKIFKFFKKPVTSINFRTKEFQLFPLQDQLKSGAKLVLKSKSDLVAIFLSSVVTTQSQSPQTTKMSIQLSSLAFLLPLALRVNDVPLWEDFSYQKIFMTKFWEELSTVERNSLTELVIQWTQILFMDQCIIKMALIFISEPVSFKGRAHCSEIFKSFRNHNIL